MKTHHVLLQNACRRALGLMATALVAGSATLAMAGPNVPYKARWVSARVGPFNPAGYTAEGVANAAHMGKVTFTTFVDMFQFVPVPSAGVLEVRFRTQTVVTAANGDELWSTGVGKTTIPFACLASPCPPYPVVIKTTIMGGTGRFAGATGEYETVGLDYNDGTVSGEDEGYISSVGSSK